jgi:hypothetical protein
MSRTHYPFTGELECESKTKKAASGRANKPQTITDSSYDYRAQRSRNFRSKKNRQRCSPSTLDPAAYGLTPTVDVPLSE